MRWSSLTPILVVVMVGCTTIYEQAVRVSDPARIEGICLHPKEELKVRNGLLHYRGDAQPFNGVIQLNADGSSGKPVRAGRDTGWVLDGPIREGNVCPIHDNRDTSGHE